MVKMKCKILNLAVAICLASSAFADIKLPKLITDGMILQRNQPIKIWGWANVNEQVKVSFNQKKYTTQTKKNGNWEIILDAEKAGGPFQMILDGENHLEINNILIGDVWVCSGQSNMELPMERVKEKYEAVIANSTNPNIRQFAIATQYNFKQQNEDFPNGAWLEANPKNLLDFSAVAYFFAKEINQKYKVPIGIIKVAVGGSPAQAWLSENTLKNYPNYTVLNQLYKNDALVDSIKKRDALISNSWNQQIDGNDLGLIETLKWYSADYQFNDWLTTTIPSFWDDAQLFKTVNQGRSNTNGVVWFKKDIQATKNMLGKPLKLYLGTIVDRDIVYVNGKLVGTTGYQYPPRRYTIPADLLKEGKNTITIRVVSNVGRGGFTRDKNYVLVNGKDSLDLAGEWHYKLGYQSKPMLSEGTTFQYQPAGLFNAMISPLFNFSIKGVLWYQGESNTAKPKEYLSLMTDLIADWRRNWNQKSLPFLSVQLTNFLESKNQPSESNWALLREAQLKSLSILATGLAVTIDIGEWNDIHPLNKEDVGKRLALAAQKSAYREKGIISSGPIYKSMKIKKDKIVLSFSDVGSGLKIARGENLMHFAIAGDDKKFVWAKAVIKGNKIEVYQDDIQNPIAVRYAWADNPNGANLCNKENLPASPFRTDDW
jgi:sialate O-acetylesterase